MLYSGVVQVSAAQQSECAIYSHIPPPLLVSPRRPHPNSPGHHRAPSGAPALYSSFHPAPCLTHGRVQRSGLLSRIVPPSPSPAISTVCVPHLLSLSCRGNRLISIISLNSTYVCVCELTYGICSSLADVSHSVRQTLDPSTSLQWTQILSLYMAESYSTLCTYHDFFTHSSLHGHEGRLHVLDTEKNTALEGVRQSQECRDG